MPSSGRHATIFSSSPKLYSPCDSRNLLDEAKNDGDIHLFKRGHGTGVARNANLIKLHNENVFAEVNRKLALLRQRLPEAKVINLGLGDTSEPISKVISSAMEERARSLSTRDGYSGYKLGQGDESLRDAIARSFYEELEVTKSEIFLSDGAKSNIARLLMLFGSDVTIAAQDPLYPIFLGLSVIMGQTGEFAKARQQYDRVVHMKCNAENGFFPDLTSLPRTDLIFFCSPNNPTGCAATRKQLEELVAFARKNGSIIVYDTAYALYISDDCPKSIYEIPGAKEVAIEIGSFSKYAGFTGVRLGWTVIPNELVYVDGYPVINDFRCVIDFSFGGISNVAEAGGLACLTPAGIQSMTETIAFYKENAKILMEAFKSLGVVRVYGGRNSPFLWLHFPGRKSGEIMDEMLEKLHILTIPGDGFGCAGEGFVRVSAFGQRDEIVEGARRIRNLGYLLLQDTAAGC